MSDKRVLSFPMVWHCRRRNMWAFWRLAEEGVIPVDEFSRDGVVAQLELRMTALLGKEAAVFLPSGTMCNEVAILTQCRPGEEILAHPTSHIYHSEGGAPWALAGVELGDNTLEIGPGYGAILRVLVDKTPRLTSVEIDTPMARTLPALIWLVVLVVWSHMKSTWPPSRSFMAGAVPL